MITSRYLNDERNSKGTICNDLEFIILNLLIFFFSIDFQDSQMIDLDVVNYNL